MDQGVDNSSYCDIMTMTEEHAEISKKRPYGQQHAKHKPRKVIEEDDETNFYDIRKMSPDMEQFSMETPEEVCNIFKLLKRRIQIPVFVVVFGISSMGILATLLGAGHCSFGKVSDLLPQSAATKALQKEGQVELALTLDHKFEADMADADSKIYESTQTKLCRGMNKALVKYNRFPKDTRTGCELESLKEAYSRHSRNGAIKVSLKLTITGSYTIPADSMYAKAVTSYVGSVKTLGSFTVIKGSVKVVASSYTFIATTASLPSTTSVPPSSTAAPPSTTAVPRYTTSAPRSKTDAPHPATAAPPSTTAAQPFANVARTTANVEHVPTTVSSYPQTEMYMKSVEGRSSEKHNITCNTYHAPLDWTELRIKAINNDDIQAVAYPNGSTSPTSSLYRVELTHHQAVVSLDVIFPSTTSCKADGSYVCILIANRTIVTSTTAMVTITDDVSNLHISVNTTVKEGDRYMINCTATLARGNGDLDLYLKDANDTEFLASAERPFTVLDDVDDVCHHSVTKTYMFLAENSQNGTEMKCVATTNDVNYVKDSGVITLTVVPADFSTEFHLRNATWKPAYSDTNSPEFQQFAEGIEHDTDYVYDRSSVKDNYKGSKVVKLSKINGIVVDMAISIDLSIVLTDSSNNAIRTTLNANDILGAFAKTLPTVSNQLPSSALAAVDTKELIGDVFVGENLPPNDCDAKTDMIFVLDASGSIGSSNFGIMKYFIQNFTATVDIGANALQIGVIKFASSVYHEFWLNTYDSPRQIAYAVNQINYTQGGTYLDAALKYTRQNAFTTEHGSRDDAARVIIVMTDGASQDDPDQVAADLKREGVVIVSIGIGGGVNQQQLLSIAYNSTFVFQVNDFNVLINIKKIVQSSTCAVQDHRQESD